MQENLHPEFKEVEIVLPSGKTMKTKSAYTKGNKILVDVDFEKHAAWTGGITQLNSSADQVANYNKKFGNLGLFGSKKAE